MAPQRTGFVHTSKSRLSLARCGATRSTPARVQSCALGVAQAGPWAQLAVVAGRNDVRRAFVGGSASSAHTVYGGELYGV